MTKERTRTIRSSGNVFRDVGFSRCEAKRLSIRADLLIEVQQRIRSSGLKRPQVAKLLGVGPLQVDDLLRGRIDLCSTGFIIALLGRLVVGRRATVRR